MHRSIERALSSRLRKRSARFNPQQQKSEVRLKESLRSEAAARRARLQQRIARRVADNARELREAGSSADVIAADEASIRMAGEVEANQLDQVNSSSLRTVGEHGIAT